MRLVIDYVSQDGRRMQMRSRDLKVAARNAAMRRWPQAKTEYGDGSKWPEKVWCREAP